MKYYTKISVNHYEKEFNGSTTGSFREADIGWRWCNDELPPKNCNIWCPVIRESKNNKQWAYWVGSDQQWRGKYEGYLDVVQWCKLPEPLKELNVSGLKGEHEDLNGMYPLREKCELPPLDITPENMYKDKARPKKPEYDKEWWGWKKTYPTVSLTQGCMEEIYQKFKERMEAER